MGALAIKAAAVVFLWLGLRGAGSRLTAVALGLITGGAVGNAIDPSCTEGSPISCCSTSPRQTIHFNWYVFNLADAAIVAGVADSCMIALFRDSAAKAPRSGS